VLAATISRGEVGVAEAEAEVGGDLVGLAGLCRDTPWWSRSNVGPDSGPDSGSEDE
jgi:hypothetical protein